MMRVALVTTWRSRCGIATYSEALASAMTQLGNTIIVHGESPRTPDDQEHVRRSWARAEFQSGPLAEQLLADKAAVVHFQHEFGLFQNDSQFIRLLDLLRPHTRIVVTLHTVARHYHGFYSMLGARGVRVVVHTSEGAAHLAHMGCESTVIPHGVHVRPPTPPERREAVRVRLGFGPCFLGVVPGFITRGKGHSEILQAFTRHMGMAHSVPTTTPQRLLIVGECRDLPESDLRGEIALKGADGAILLHAGFQESLDDYFRAADYILLGSNTETPFSASGQLHTALGWGLPIVAKNSPIYRGTEGVLLYDQHQDAADMLHGLWNSRALRDCMSMKSREAAEARSWERVAAAHLHVYAVAA